MPLAIEPITNAPSKADQALPRPPKRLVPPITAAAIALSNTSPAPEDWLTASRRDPARMPPHAAKAEHKIKTWMRIRSTLMPARRAASALPPTANTYRPNRVIKSKTTIKPKDQHGRRDTLNGIESLGAAIDAHDSDGYKDGRGHERDSSNQRRHGLRLHACPSASPLLTQQAQDIRPNKNDADDPSERDRQASVGKPDDQRIGQVDGCQCCPRHTAKRLASRESLPG